MSRPDYYGNPSGITRDGDTVRAIFAAFARRDLEAALQHIAPDCELYLRGTAQVTGRADPYFGHAGVREYFADAATAWDELILHADDFRMMPGVVMVLGSVTARRSGVSARRSVVWTWRLGDDGKVTSVRVADTGELRDP